MQTVNSAKGGRKCSENDSKSSFIDHPEFPGIAKADKIDLTQEEWYKLYLSSGRFLP